MNKRFALALLLIASPLLSMEETEQEFLTSLNVFQEMLEKQTNITIQQALKVLKKNNLSTPQATQAKIKALQFLFTFNSSHIDAVKLIRATKHGLIFKGDCRDSFAIKDLKAIEEGNFSVDYNKMPMLTGPRLIIGKRTVPTIQEYNNLVVHSNQLSK